MAEDFQESEMIFLDRDHHHHLRRDDDNGDDYFNCREMVAATRRNYRTVRDGRKSKKKMASSLPVGIPQRSSGRRGDEEELHEEWDEEEMVPPHVITERRVARKMAFSVCTGNGRTLKGRDLSQVRNSILRMTGFLEA